MEKKFYENGLNFECTQCSKCCRFDPGYVFLSHNDLDRLLTHFNLPRDLFIEKYCRTVDIGNTKRLSLIEKPNYDCIFWNDGGCTIYGARPLQCRSYPFWKPFLTDKEAWDREAESCPGMNSGKLVQKDVIEEWLKIRQEEEYITVEN